MSVTAILGSRRGTQPTAGVATNLVITTQPSGAANGVAFTTQPVVEVRDGLGDLVTGSSIAVTVAKASGSGTLSGDATVEASSGVVTFTDLVITGTGDHQLTFTATGLAGTTSSTFDVSDGSGVAALFESDWSTATGTSENALSDGGKWNYVTDVDSAHAIVSATGLGFPAGMTNVYRVEQTSHSMHVAIQNGWPAVGIGESVYFRWYESLASFGTLESARNDWHCPQSEIPNWVPGNDNGWAFLPRMTSDGFYCRVTLNDGASSNWRMITAGLAFNPVPKDDVYRIELKFHREADTTWRFEMRWYDSSNVLVRTHSDLRLSDGTQFVSANVNCFGDGEELLATSTRCIVLGTNGGPDYTGLGYRYFGGVMVRSDDWCGAY